MSTPIFKYIDEKNGMILEVEKGTGGASFFIHEKGKDKGQKIWLRTEKNLDDLIISLRAWFDLD